MRRPVSEKTWLPQCQKVPPTSTIRPFSPLRHVCPLHFKTGHASPFTETRDRHIYYARLHLYSVAGKAVDKFTSLRKFLQDTDLSASDVIQGDVGSTCADPKRWLNPAGHDLLSTLPGFNQYNASMLWGSYRPGVYFGEDVGDENVFRCHCFGVCICEAMEVFHRSQTLVRLINYGVSFIVISSTSRFMRVSPCAIDPKSFESKGSITRLLDAL